MTTYEVSPERLISLLAYDSTYMCTISNNISEEETVVFSTLSRSSSSEGCSMGLLDRLPLELLWTVLGSLDFRTLSRMLQVCWKAKAQIEVFPPYQDIVRHAPTALIALSETTLIGHHTSNSLHRALTTDACFQCQEFGPCLYLPTCERCCYNCLATGQPLRLISFYTAKLCFGVQPKHLKQLPILRSIPGDYLILSAVSTSRSTKLLSLKQVREKALTIHGSEEAMRAFVALQDTSRVSDLQFHTVNFLTGPIRPHGAPLPERCPRDIYCGMGAVAFPYLRNDGTVAQPLRCSGCRSIHRRRSVMELPATSRDEYPDCTYSQLFWSRETRARLKEEFLDHIKECEGAKRLLLLPESH